MLVKERKDLTSRDRVVVCATLKERLSSLVTGGGRERLRDKLESGGAGTSTVREQKWCIRIAKKKEVHNTSVGLLGYHVCNRHSKKVWADFRRLLSNQEAYEYHWQGKGWGGGSTLDESEEKRILITGKQWRTSLGEYFLCLGRPETEACQ